MHHGQGGFLQELLEPGKSGAVPAYMESCILAVPAQRQPEIEYPCLQWIDVFHLEKKEACKAQAFAGQDSSPEWKARNNTHQ